jgi:hypothetical protein
MSTEEKYPEEPVPEEIEETDEEEFEDDDEEFEDEDEIVYTSDIELDEEPMMELDMGGLLGSVLTTEDGDTVCSALVNISKQLEMQNRIMIKILSQLQKNT